MVWLGILGGVGRVYGVFSFTLGLVGWVFLVGVGRVYGVFSFTLGLVGEPALTGCVGWGFWVGWGGFAEIFRLPWVWLVNPPLQAGLVGDFGWGGAGLLRFFV